MTAHTPPTDASPAHLRETLIGAAVWIVSPLATLVGLAVVIARIVRR